MTGVTGRRLIATLVERAKEAIGHARRESPSPSGVLGEEGSWDVDVVVQAAGGAQQGANNTPGSGVVLLCDCWVPQRSVGGKKKIAATEPKVVAATALVYRSGVRVVPQETWPAYATAVRVTWNLPEPYWRNEGATMSIDESDHEDDSAADEGDGEGDGAAERGDQEDGDTASCSGREGDTDNGGNDVVDSTTAQGEAVPAKGADDRGCDADSEEDVDSDIDGEVGVADTDHTEGDKGEEGRGSNEREVGGDINVASVGHDEAKGEEVAEEEDYCFAS
jgi:hypothetical protein